MAGALLCCLAAAAGQQIQASAEGALKAAADREPRSFAANFAYGGWLAGAGRVQESIRYFEMACSADPEHYDCGHDLAVAYLQTSRFAEAADLLKDRLAFQPTAEMHNLLGAALEASGSVEEGVRELQRAAEMDPSEKNVFDFGAALLRYQAYEQSLAILEYGAFKHPSSARMKVALGSALYARGRFDEAVEALCLAVDLDPSDQRALYFLGQMHDVSAAMAAEVSNRLAGFARRFPDSAAAHLYYGLSVWKVNQPEPSEAAAKEAAGLLGRAAALDPDLHEAHYHLGLIHERFGRPEEAVGAYLKAVEADPDYDSALYRLGMAYRRLGRTADADAALQRYREVHERKRQLDAERRRPALDVR